MARMSISIRTWPDARVTGLDRGTIRVRITYGTAAERDNNGDCLEQAGTGSKARKKQELGQLGRNTLQASVSSHTIAKEIVAEIDGTLTSVQVDALARRHGLRRIESQSFELIGIHR